MCQCVIGQHRNFHFLPSYRETFYARIYTCFVHVQLTLRFSPGQERPAIVVSTVRSEKEQVMRLDQLLGFLANPKRFNVTISRAQSALVVVGNPIVLCNDPQWLHFLRYVIANGGYTGCNLDPISHVLNIDEG